MQASVVKLAYSCVLAGCFAARAYPGAPCADNNQCPSGLTCIADRCVLPGTEPDAAAKVDAKLVDGAQALDAYQLTAPDVIATIDMETCKAAFACESSYPDSSSQFTTDWGASVSDCDMNAAAFDAPATIAADVASGEIKYTAADAASCLAALGYDCATFWNQGLSGQTQCEAAIMGTVPDGSACHIDWDCATWTSCCDLSNHQCTNNCAD